MCVAYGTKCVAYGQVISPHMEKYYDCHINEYIMTLLHLNVKNMVRNISNFIFVNKIEQNMLKITIFMIFDPTI